jgi:hypothetical protein
MNHNSNKRLFKTLSTARVTELSLPVGHLQQPELLSTQTTVPIGHDW